MNFPLVLTVTLATSIFINGVATKVVTLQRLEVCDPKADYPIKMAVKLKNMDKQQMIEESTLETKIPLGNNILDVVDVYIKQEGKFDHFVTIREALCDALQKYLGDFMHDLQKSAGVEPGTCPMPPGNYKIVNHLLDFQKFKFKSVPQGEFRLKVNLMDIKTNETLHCHEIEFMIQ